MSALEGQKLCAGHDHKYPSCFAKRLGDDSSCKKASSTEKRRRDDDDDSDNDEGPDLDKEKATSTTQQQAKKKCLVGSKLIGSKLTLPGGMQPIYITSDLALVAVMKGLKERLRQVCDSQVLRAGGLLYMSLDAEWTVRGKGEAQVS